MRSMNRLVADMKPRVGDSTRRDRLTRNATVPPAESLRQDHRQVLPSSGRVPSWKKALIASVTQLFPEVTDP